MLIELAIRNLAIIESVRLTLAPGFNVLTGETGAGKSMVVEALGLLSGDRASADQVRTGCEKALVEGTFEGKAVDVVASQLLELGIEVEEDRVILRREVASNGRSRAWINGTSVTTSLLSGVGHALVNIHGQHDARGLLDPDVQRDIVDRFGGASALVESVASAFDRVESIRGEIRTLTARRDQAARRADYLRHVVQEITETRLVAGEEERLDEEARRLTHVEELRLHLGEVLAVLEGEEGGAQQALGTARRLLGAAARLDPSLSRVTDLLDGVVTELREVTRDVTHYEAALEADPQRLAEVERRRDQIYRLRQKHGGSVESVLAALEESRAELDVLDTAATDLGALAQREVESVQALGALAAELTRARTAAAKTLAKAVDAILPELGMTDGRFRVALSGYDAPQRSGSESVEFRVTLNAGLDERPLARVASGGELARVMLALTTVLAEQHPVPTLIFDEVDAGVGGRVAHQVGALMRRAAGRHQVLAITHLAQIAALAHQQVVVSKGAADGVTTADLSPVSGKAREREIARMLGGNESAASLRHARELLGAAVGR